MVEYRKPDQRSPWIDDRRSSQNAQMLMVSQRARDARAKQQFAQMLKRLQEQHQRALRQQLTGGR